MNMSLDMPPGLPNFSIVDFLYSCNDDNLNSTGVTDVRWRTTTPNSALATAVVLLIFMVIAIPANLFILVMMVWKKLYHQPTHILLFNLALNDLLMSSTYLPINFISAIAGEFIFGGDDVTRCAVCKTGVIFIIFAHFNLYILALISLDRFLFIKLPFKYSRIVTVKSTLVVVVITWIFCVLISIPPVFKFGEIRFTSVISTCSLYLLSGTDVALNIYYEVFSIAQTFLIPVPILIVTNVWVICIVRKQFKKIYKTRQTMEEKGNIAKYRSGLKHKLNRQKNKRQLRLVKIYLVILISNLLTWMPNIVNTIGLFIVIYKQVIIPNGFFVSNYLFFLSQVILHPLIQTWLIPDIKKTLTGIWAKCCCTCNDTVADNIVDRETNNTTSCFRCWDMIGAAILPQGGSTFRGNGHLGLSKRDSRTVSIMSPMTPVSERKFECALEEGQRHATLVTKKSNSPSQESAMEEGRVVLSPVEELRDT